ncbi:Vegetative incompatibility protein, partial [Colletotrichum sp. SAR 10_96]
KMMKWLVIEKSVEYGTAQQKLDALKAEKHKYSGDAATKISDAISTLETSISVAAGNLAGTNVL